MTSIHGGNKLYTTGRALGNTHLTSLLERTSRKISQVRFKLRRTCRMACLFGVINNWLMSSFFLSPHHPPLCPSFLCTPSSPHPLQVFSRSTSLNAVLNAVLHALPCSFSDCLFPLSTAQAVLNVWGVVKLQTSTVKPPALCSQVSWGAHSRLHCYSESVVQEPVGVIKIFSRKSSTASTPPVLPSTSLTSPRLTLPMDLMYPWSSELLHLRYIPVKLTSMRRRRYAMPWQR